MLSTTWTPHALSAESRLWQCLAWRMVESQHIASTMKLVDTRDEQDVLESLLDQDKPARATDTSQLHYLLATPFRYSPLRTGSRFRAYADPGVYYAAESVRTAAAELGFWRWRFLMDAPSLERIGPVAHTAFNVKLSTTAIDLREPSFDLDLKRWRVSSDYASTQHLARVARQAEIGSIVYPSARDPEPAWCVALLFPSGFARKKPEPISETWYLAVSSEEVVWRRDHQSIRFSTTPWFNAD